MKTRKHKHKAIQHHHLLMRVETTTCPLEKDKEAVKRMIQTILKDIGMHTLDKPHVYYQKTPRNNEGLTAFVPITTSHLAFHFWRWPEKAILSNSSSQCLLEFDLYTCGTLMESQIKKILQNLTPFGPTHVDATLINRKRAMSIETHMNWDASDSSWDHFCGK